MSRAEQLRASITATLAELQAGHHALGLNPDWREMAEAAKLIRKIENRWAAMRPHDAPANREAAK